MKDCILIIPNNIKKEIIKLTREKYYNYNIKFMSLEEFIKKYIFDYDNKTIYNLMKKENIGYDTAIIYLKNLYYISDKIQSKKMKKLKELKAYLDSENLLIYNHLFKDYVKDKIIYIYGYDSLDKYTLDVLKDLNYKIIEKEYKNNNIKQIYHANYIEEELLFVANKIVDLLKKGINISNIKLILPNEYTEITKRIFKLMNIPINLPKGSIYSTYECKKILNNLNSLEYLDEIKNTDIKNKIIEILNNYSFIEDKEEVKKLIIRDLKNTHTKENKQGIDIITLNDLIAEEDHIFLLGYNKENIPIVHKDNEYFNDKEKKILGLFTSTEKNIIEREATIKKIQDINNLIITYKEYDSNNNYTKSDLIADIEEIEINNDNYSHSNMLNKIILTQKLDNLVKFNIREKDLDLLYNNYDIPYMQYDNSYKKIDKNKLYQFLDNKLVLAYTSFDNYNRCKFKYYINNILKINIIEDDFGIIIGNICHYVLSNIDNEDFDTFTYFDKYIKTQREFTQREQFFLSIIREEMPFIVDTILKQMTYSTFDKKMYEEKVFVNMDKEIKVTFMGVIDKVLYKEEDDKTYLVVIDYKTGSTNIKLDNLKYGIGLQLPIYLYLSSQMKLKNIVIAGFYLQKLLNNNLDSSKDYQDTKENSLKLEGYSTSNESVLSKFDTTYNNSKLIQSMKTTTSGFYAYSKVLDEQQINNLVSETDKLINTAADSILEADFTINPKVIDGDNISCNFCEYKDICYRKEKDLIYINNE